MKHFHKSDLVPDGATQMSPMASISSSCKITHQNIVCPTSLRLWRICSEDWLQFGALAFLFWLGPPLTKRQMNRTFKHNLPTISSKHVPHTGRHSDSNDEERHPCLSPAKVWNRDNYGPSSSKAHTKRKKDCIFHLQESRSCMNSSSLY